MAVAMTTLGVRSPLFQGIHEYFKFKNLGSEILPTFWKYLKISDLLNAGAGQGQGGGRGSSGGGEGGARRWGGGRGEEVTYMPIPQISLIDFHKLF